MKKVNVETNQSAIESKIELVEETLLRNISGGAGKELCGGDGRFGKYEVCKVIIVIEKPGP